MGHKESSPKRDVYTYKCIATLKKKKKIKELPVTQWVHLVYLKMEINQDTN